MTDKQPSFFQKIIEGGLWFSAASFGTKVIGLATTFFIIRLLDTYEFGLYKLVIAFYGILSLFFFFGIDQIVLTDLMRAKADKNHSLVNRILLEFFSFKIAVGVVLFAATFFGASFVETWYGADIAHLVRIISFWFLIIAVERVANLVFNYYLAFRAMALFTFLEEAVKLLALIFFIFVVDLGVSGVVLAMVVSSGAAILFFTPYAITLARRMPRAPLASGMAIIGAFVSYGKWAVGLRYVGDFQKYVRPWLIRYFLSTEAVGVYAIAESLYSQIVGLFPLGNVLLPTVSQNIKDRSSIRNLLRYGIKYGTPFFLLLGVAAAVAVPIIVTVIFPQHVASLPVFYVFLLTLITTGVGPLLTAIFYAEREQQAHFFIMMATLAITLIAGFALIPILGVYGMALEFVVSAFFFNIVRLWFIFRRFPDLRFSPRRIFSFGEEDKAVIRHGITSVKGLIFRR